MQIDIFYELTGILDPCEGIEQSPETSAAKNTFSRETTKRNSRLVPLIDIISGRVIQVDDYDLLMFTHLPLPSGCVWATKEGQYITVPKDNVWNIKDFK